MNKYKANGADHGKYRTDVDDNYLLQLNNDGYSCREIGEIVKMEHHSVKQRIVKAGGDVKTNPNKDTSNFIFPLEEALILYNKGFSCNAISKQIKCDSKIVKKYLIRAGIIFAKSNYNSKDLNDKMDRIKELYEKGYNYTEIGKILNTTGTTIKTYLKKAGIV